MKIREDLPKMEPMEELPLQIMESKEDMPSDLIECDSDHLYYMSENCSRPTNISQDCKVVFDSDESGGI